MNHCIAIIGTGAVGTTTAYSLIMHNLCSEILLIDSDQKKCKGEQLDLADTLGFSAATKVTLATYEDARNAKIIIITAGAPQKPGQSRSQLITTNKSIITDIIDKLSPISTDSIVIIVTNPVDALTTLVQQLTNLPHTHIIGSSTWLDTQRLRRLTAEKLDVAPESLPLYVVGEHGPAQYITWNNISLAGTPLDYWNITEQSKQELGAETIDTVNQIICAKGATFFGVAACITDLCKAIIFNEKRIIPVSTYSSAYHVCMGLPAIIGANGVEQLIPLNPTPEEEAILIQAQKNIQKLL